MTKVKVELDQGAIRRQLLKGAEITATCEKLARDIQKRAGAGFETSVLHGRTRVNASVGAASDEAYWDNMNHNTLLKAMR